MRETKSNSDWRDVYAGDAEHAAAKFADRHDCENEYWILQQGDRCEAVIEVRDPNSQITRWRIRAESVPHYYAEKMETDDAEGLHSADVEERL